MNQASEAEWLELYQAGIAFRQAVPWQWMASEDVFAIVNPGNGEVGYCSILGNGGQQFGLAIFLSKQGLRLFTTLTGDEPGSDDLDEAIMTPLLTFLLADREELHGKDRQVIRSLGLSFRGKSAWPLFRSQKPGYAPWFLEKDEVIYLTAALQQALEIAGRVRHGDLDLQRHLMKGKVIVRYLAQNVWQEELRTLDLPASGLDVIEEPLGAANEATLYLLKDRAKERSGCWELDVFLVPIHIGPADSRPYHPLCFMAVNRDYGLVVHTDMAQPWLTVSEKRGQIIRLLEKSDTIPSEIRVRSQKIRTLLEPIADALGIRLRALRLQVLDEAKASLYSYLSRKRT